MRTSLTGRNWIPQRKRAEYPVKFAAGPDPRDQWPVLQLFVVWPEDRGFLFVDCEGKRLWQSATGKGDFTWEDPLLIPDILKRKLAEWTARHERAA